MYDLSWLNPTPHATAVYASCSALLPPHATLASRRPATALPGLDFHQLIAPALAGAFGAVGTRVASRPPQSGRVEARTGLRMMPTFPRPSLSFRTAGFPRYGWEGGMYDGALPPIAAFNT